jgi:hypothetical protein
LRSIKPPEKKKNGYKNYIIAISIIVLVFLILHRIFDFSLSILDFSESLLLLIYLPGFFLLTGLIDAWLPAKLVAKHLGSRSGFMGSVYSFLIGSLMVGPLYLAFPMAIILLKKGISKFNVILFIGAWSVFPVGQEIFEIHFMGFRFFMLRAILSIIFVVLISVIMDKMHLFRDDKLHLKRAKKH